MYMPSSVVDLQPFRPLSVQSLIHKAEVVLTFQAYLVKL
jgi:hypothetical protein